MQATFQHDLTQLQSDVKLLLKQMQMQLNRSATPSNYSAARTSAADYTGELTRLSGLGEYYMKAVELLKSLSYDSMGFRYSKVATAHARTYEWAYTHAYARWLKSEEQLFWISGKPGSGKSTLMKYLVNDARTEGCLRQWAGDRSLMIASYFFWINGNDLQRSQEGLLRSVLFDILRGWPDILDTVLHSPLALQCFGPQGLMLPSWTFESLFALLEFVMQRLEDTHCFCFFIDVLTSTMATLNF